MATKPHKSKVDNPFASEPEAAEDLWFLPGPVEHDPDDLPPLPRADRRPLFDAAEWRKAEAALAPDLADLAFDLGRLAERLSEMGDGARRRLALQEAASLGWWTGDRISADRLALWLALHLGAAGDDAPALSRLAWAVRRLSSPEHSGEGATRIAAELGLGGEAFSDRLHEAAEIEAGLTGLHPVVRGCILFHVWRLAGDEPQRRIEAAVLGARIGAGRAGFLPLSLAGLGPLTVSGSPDRRLSGWIAGAHQSVLAALLHLDRLRRWQHRATEATADLSGRTPSRLISALVRLPMVSAPVAEMETGASRAAVQRNFDLFSQRGLIREITGQGRYRVWTATL